MNPNSFLKSRLFPVNEAICNADFSREVIVLDPSNKGNQEFIDRTTLELVKNNRNYAIVKEKSKRFLKLVDSIPKDFK